MICILYSDVFYGELFVQKHLILAVLLGLFITTTQTASSEEIGVILPGKVLGMWQGMSRGIKRATEDLHVNMLLRSPADGASLETQDNIQLTLIDYMLKRGVSGIILAPEPLEGVKTPISLTVPLVLVDRSSMNFNALSIVSTDNFAAGRAAALSLAPVLHKGAKIAVLRLAANISSTTEREKGFLSMAHERGWEVVIDTYVGYRFRESQELTNKALSTYTGHIDAVFAPAEPVAYGAVRVIEAMPLNMRPRLVALDWRPEFLDALQHGVLYSAILQDPYHMGYQAAKTLIEASRGIRPIQQKQFIDVVTVTSANVNSPEAQMAIANYGE